MGTHTVGCVGKLARDFRHQQVMIPAGAVALDEVSGTIECVGLGRIIADADRYVGMEGQVAVARVVDSELRTADSRLSAALDILLRE